MWRRIQALVIKEFLALFKDTRSRMVVLPKAATVADVARAMNALGVTARDLISIFQGLKRAGALNAELEII